MSWIRLLYAYPTGHHRPSHRDDRPQREDRSLSRYPHAARQRPDSQGHAPAGHERRPVPAPRPAPRGYVRYCPANDTDRGISGRDAEPSSTSWWHSSSGPGSMPSAPSPISPRRARRRPQFPDQVPDEVKQARLEELMLAQQEIAFAKNEERIGSRLTCLVEEGGRRAEDAGRRATPRSATRVADGSTARPRTSTVSASSEKLLGRRRAGSWRSKSRARRTTIWSWSKFDIEATWRPGVNSSPCGNMSRIC